MARLAVILGFSSDTPHSPTLVRNHPLLSPVMTASRAPKVLSPLAADLPAARRPARSYRATTTEIQRSTAGGGWLTVAVAEDPDWAETIARCLNFFDSQPIFSDVHEQVTGPNETGPNETGHGEIGDCWDDFPVYGGGTPAR